MGILSPQPLGAIGSAGQNTQDSQIDLPPEFVISAVNCFADQNGRMTARKSLKRRTSDNGDLGTTNGVKRVYRHNLADGTSVFACSGNGRIFTATATTLTSRSSGHSADLWQFATLNGKLFAAQASHTFRYFTESTWAETTIATPSQPRAIHAAFGRLWALSSDGWTLYWSDLLDGTNFTTGASGSIDLAKLHTAVRSPATAVLAFGRQMVVLCQSQIIVLGLADDLDPGNSTTPIYLAEAIGGVGCISRDTAVVAGDDLLFLAADGVRSLRRSLAEQQGPSALSSLSVLNKDVVISYIGAETAAEMSAAWDYRRAWYQLFLPTANRVITLDMSRAQQRPPVMTEWTLGSRPTYHAAVWTDDSLWYAVTGGLGDNSAYDADDSYDMELSTGWLSFGMSPVLKHLKTLLLSTRGGDGQTAVLKWSMDFKDSVVRSRSFALSSGQDSAEYGVAEYNVDEYTGGISAIDSDIKLGGSGKFVKFTFVLPVSGRQVTVDNAQVFTNRGRIK